MLQSRWALAVCAAAIFVLSNGSVRTVHAEIESNDRKASSVASNADRRLRVETYGGGGGHNVDVGAIASFVSAAMPVAQQMMAAHAAANGGGGGGDGGGYSGGGGGGGGYSGGGGGATQTGGGY